MGRCRLSGTAFSSLGNRSDKPRVRAEPDEPKALLTFFVDAEKFSHGFPAFDHHTVGIVNDAITDRVGYNLRADFVTPPFYVELRTEDNGAFLVSALCNLQQIPRLRFFKPVQQPLVENQQRGLLYCSITLEYVLVALAIASSVNSSGNLTYLT